MFCSVPYILQFFGDWIRLFLEGEKKSINTDWYVLKSTVFQDGEEDTENAYPD